MMRDDDLDEICKELEPREERVEDLDPEYRKTRAAIEIALAESTVAENNGAL